MALTLHGNNGVITTNGTAAAPSFAAPDTDTGLYFGTNLIHATTSGTNRFNIDANGRVLIGLTSSTNDNTLTLQGSSGGNYNSRLELRRGGNPSSGQGLGTIYFANNAGKWGAGIYAAAAENWTSGSAHGTDLVFQTVDNTTTTLDERVRITQNGKVGIGSNNPDVYSADADNLILRTTSSTGMTIRSGSTSGGSIFFANDDNSTSNEGIFQYLHNDKAFILNNYGGGNEKFIYKNRGSEVFRIRASGQVEFKNGSFSDNVNCIMASGSNLELGATATIKLRTATNERLQIDSNGSVHVGFSGESLYFQNASNNSNARIQNAGASNNSNLRFLTRSSGTEVERVRIKNDGEVLIGTGGVDRPIAGQRFNSASGWGGSIQLERSNPSAGNNAVPFFAITAWNGANEQYTGGISFNRSNNNTQGTHGAVNTNQQLGNIAFNGSDGTNFIQGAEIFAIPDQTFATNDGPASLVFGTVPDGTSETRPQERLRIDSTGRVLIGSTAKAGDSTLQVYTSDRKHPAIRTNSPNANGYTMYSDAYKADESQANIGISYSSASLVLSSGCKVSDSSDDAYLSSQDTYATRPCALRIDTDGSLSFHSTETSTTRTTDSAASINEVFKVDMVGNIYQRITNRYMFFGASNQLKIGIVSSDPVIDALSGHLQLKKSGSTIAIVRDDHLQMYADIKMNNDKGISFINADDTASGETVSSSVLDDYEEGTFTATLKGHTDPSNTSSTNANKTATTTGRYVKVGQSVTVTMRWYNIQNNGADEMHNCQLQNIHGLPYHSSNTSTNWSASIGYQRGLYPRWSSSSVTSQAVWMYGYIEGNDDKVQLRCSQSTGPGTLYPTVHDSTSHMYMTFTITYQSLA